MNLKSKQKIVYALLLALFTVALGFAVGCSKTEQKTDVVTVSNEEALLREIALLQDEVYELREQLGRKCGRGRH